jgi:hypothetical protein
VVQKSLNHCRMPLEGFSTLSPSCNLVGVGSGIVGVLRREDSSGRRSSTGRELPIVLVGGATRSIDTLKEDE